MGWGAGRKLSQIIANVTAILGVELLVASQGIESRLPLRPGTGVDNLHRLIRAQVPSLDEDRPIAAEMQEVAALIASGKVEEVLAGLGITEGSKQANR
jgi:histidine ammonia-lyase